MEKQSRIDMRDNIQHALISNTEDGRHLLGLLKEKKSRTAEINKQIKAEKNSNCTRQMEALKIEKEEILERLDEQIAFVRESLSDEYLKQYRNVIVNYPIFMAIVEDVGYDASGKETGKNELPEISKELFAFIQAIEEGTDCFFR